MLYNEIYESKSNFTIYVDMDGVVANFDQGFYDATGKWPKDISHEELKALKKQLVAEGDFFYNLKPMPGAKQLWNYVNKYNAKILTATGDTEPDKVATEKRRWAKKILGVSNIIVVRKLPMKAEYANPTSILIDDREKALKPWKNAGGIGIHFTDVASAIKQLKSLGL